MHISENAIMKFIMYRSYMLRNLFFFLKKKEQSRGKASNQSAVDSCSFSQPTKWGVNKSPSS